MPFVDQSSPDPQVQGGALARQKMLDAGAPQPQVDAFIASKRQQMLDAGAPLDQVNTYFGIGKPDTTTMSGVVADAAANQTLASKPAPPGFFDVMTPPGANETRGMLAPVIKNNETGALRLGLPEVLQAMSLPGDIVTGKQSLDPRVDVKDQDPQTMAQVGVLSQGITMGETMPNVFPKAPPNVGEWSAAAREAVNKIYNKDGPYTAKEALGDTPVNTAGMPAAEDYVAGARLALGPQAGAMQGTGASARFVPTKQGADMIQNLQDIYQRTGMTPDETIRLSQSDNQVRQEIMRTRTAGGDQLTPAIDAYAANLGRATGKTFGPVPTSPFEPLKVEPKPAEGANPEEPAPGFMKPEQVPQQVLDTFRTLEASPDIGGRPQISPTKAVGRYQIEPDTARQYGFDPDLLKDDAYNERAARAILADLNNRFKGNLADMAVAYNAGPGRAQAWIRGGRDFYSLPLETQKYLLHAEKIGAIDSGFTTQAARVDLSDDPVVSRAGDTPASEAPEVKPPVPDEAPPLEGGPLSKAQSDAEFAKMRGTIEPPSGWGSKLNLGEVWRGFQFQLTPAHGFDQAVGLGSKRVGTEDVLRATLGTNGQADQFYTHGPVNLTFDEHGEPVFNPTQGPNFIDAYKLVGKSGGNIRDFDNYRIALRTLEKAEQGVKTGISKEAAKAQVNAPGAFEKYDAAHRMLQKAWDGVNKFSIASGMMSPERVAAMNALNEEYVPLNRLVDNKYVPPKWGSMFGIKQNYKVMEGSDRPFVPPAIAEMDNVNARVRAATRNVAVKFTIDRLREIDPEMATLVKITKGIAVKEVREAMAALKGEDGEPLPDDAKAAIEPELTAKELLASLKSQGKSNPDTDVVVFRDGQPEVWRIHDPEIARMIKESTGGPDDPLPGLFGAFGRLATSGIVSAPTFPFRALWHAAITAPLYSEGGTQVPFGDMLYGTIAAIAGDKIGGKFKGAYERYAANGGVGGTFNEVNRNMIEPRLRDVMNGKSDPTTGIVNVVHHPLEALRIMQHMVHNSMQVGAMIASEQRGQPTLRAAMLARKAGLDYAEKFNSPVVNTFMRGVPFGSTGFKDIQQVTQGFSDHPLATGIKVAGFLTLPAVVLTLANLMADQNLPDNEKWANKPQWERDSYFIFPPMANGVRLRLPMPYVGGAMFAAMPSRIVHALWDQAHGDSHQAGLDMENWASAMIARMTPQYLPVAAVPTLEQVTNHSFYLNRPLVPDSQAKLSGDMQYGANTSSTSKAVAKFLSDQHLAIFNAHLDKTSPIVLDNYVSQWTGTAGSALWHGLGQVLIPEKATAPKDISDNPFWGSFFSRHQEAPEILNTFYDRLGQVNAAHADFAKATKEGDQAAIAKKQGNPLLSINLNPVAKALANMRGFTNAINKSDMTDAEKLTQTDAITNQMIALANAYVKQVDQISSASKQ